MSNHVHLAIQLADISLSKIIQNLAFRYTRFYNWRHQTIGHLFQGRFKSILVDSNRYLSELIRYIHLNPVRAKMVEDPIHYRWSSYKSYLMMDDYTWLSKDRALLQFGASRSEAITAFRNFVLDGIGMEDEDYFEKGFSDGILGQEEFINEISSDDNKEELSSFRSSKVDLATLISFVSKKYEVDSQSLQKSDMDRKSTHIRAVTALLAREAQGVTLAEVAEFFGRESSGISKAAARLEFRMLTSDALNKEVNNLIAEWNGRGEVSLCQA